MDVHIWDINDESRPLKFVYKNHTEFVHGLDFSLYHKRFLEGDEGGLI